MPIPNDPLDRWWIDALLDDQQREDYKSVLCVLVSLSRTLQITVIGTGFIVATNPNSAIVLTATHNLEGASRAQATGAISHPSALSQFVASPLQRLSLRADRFRVIYQRDGRAEMCISSVANVSPPYDVAVLAIHPPEPREQEPLFSHKVDIDTAPPEVGRELYLISYLLNYEQSVVEDGGTEFEVTAAVTLRTGIVTAVHPNGVRHIKWPCFETSIPVEPGMSGGMYVWARPDGGGFVTACGVVSADFSNDESKTNYTISGASIGTMLWPALSLKVPGVTAGADTEPTERTISDFVRVGSIHDVNSGHLKVATAQLQDGNTLVTYGPLTPKG